ncbi:hypothetical protein ABBQ32_000628 [Trebouxia sp. C0010 RCD-2024]
MQAAAAEGAVPLLVALLRADQPSVQQKAAGALSNLSAGSQQSMDAIIVAGAELPTSCSVEVNGASCARASRVLVKLAHLFWGTVSTLCWPTQPAYEASCRPFMICIEICIERLYIRDCKIPIKHHSQAILAQSITACINSGPPAGP